MTKNSADAPTPASSHQDASHRLLPRLPPDLERGFGAEYYARIRPTLRAVVPFLAALFAACAASHYTDTGSFGLDSVRLVILLTMPWLLLLARTPVYPPFRVVSAVLIGVAAAAWFLERALDWNTLLAPLVERATAHELRAVAGLAALSILASLVSASGRRRRSATSWWPCRRISAL